MEAPTQLSLGVTLRDEATFANFYIKTGNAQALTVLRQLAQGEELHNHVFWGAPGCGLTHLLQAVCHEASEFNRTIQFLPMRDVMGFEANAICEGLEGIDIVCVDGIDVICGNREWEHAFFHLFNKVKDAGHTLLFSSHSSPPTLPILLADLKSRLLGSVIYHIESLTDVEKQAAMIMRAQARGLELADEVAKYILSRASRDTNELFYLLNRLDDASLQQQRKITIPFVKDILRL